MAHQSVLSMVAAQMALACWAERVCSCMSRIEYRIIKIVGTKRSTKCDPGTADRVARYEKEEEAQNKNYNLAIN